MTSLVTAYDRASTFDVTGVFWAIYRRPWTTVRRLVITVGLAACRVVEQPPQCAAAKTPNTLTRHLPYSLPMYSSHLHAQWRLQGLGWLDTLAQPGILWNLSSVLIFCMWCCKSILETIIRNIRRPQTSATAAGPAKFLQFPPILQW